jgi:hypothetical protein
MSDLPIPTCKLCYKDLPVEFQGFDICPFCLLRVKEHEAKRIHMRRVTYASPLTRLNREPSGHNR